MNEPKVFVERNAYVPGMGTFGVMTVPARGFRCVTVEQDWEDNKPSVSCIPEGAYPLVRGWFNRKNYEVFEIKDVPGRSEIKIHKANTMDELQGCIAPGVEYGVFKGRWAVVSSTVAFQQFMASLEGVENTVIVISSVFHQGTVGLSPS